MRENNKIKILITSYLICVVLSNFIPIAFRHNWIHINYESSYKWIDVFWASFNNIALVGCFWLLILNNKISNTDKRFLSFSIIVNVAQCAMYCLCPLANQGTIDLAFLSFCVLTFIGLIITWGG